MNGRATRGRRRPSVRDVQDRLEQLAGELGMLAGAVSALNASTRRELNLLMTYIAGLRDALMARGLLTAEDVRSLAEILTLEGCGPPTGATTRRPRRERDP